MPNVTHVGRVKTYSVQFPILTANTNMFVVTLHVFSAYGFDYTPSPTPNGTYFSFGDLSPITIQFEGQIVGEEEFNVGSTAVHRIFHNVTLGSWVSPFTALFKPMSAGLLPGNLPAIRAEVEYTKYYPPSYSNGRTQAVFLLRAQQGDIGYGANFFIDRPGTESDTLFSFLSRAISGNIIECGYTEDFYLINHKRAQFAGDEKHSKVWGSGFSANILLGVVRAITPIPESEIDARMGIGLG